METDTPTMDTPTTTDTLQAMEIPTHSDQTRIMETMDTVTIMLRAQQLLQLPRRRRQRKHLQDNFLIFYTLNS